MSPAMNAFASIGITHNILILIVLALVAAGVIGLFWHYILPGAIIIGVAALFYVAPDAPKPVDDAKEEVVFDEYAAYMKDCMDVADYNRNQCEDLWNGRQIEERELGKLPEEKHAEVAVDFQPASKVKLIEVDNVEYKARRAEALKKPNAVVLQATYR
jgi:hypothetical protein